MKYFILIVLILAGVYFFNQSSHEETPIETAAYTFGTYPYRCDDDTEFLMSPAEDMSTLLIERTSGEGVSPITLAKTEREKGARYEGAGVVFEATGETVRFSVAGATRTCTPVPNPESPPFNFGD